MTTAELVTKVAAGKTFGLRLTDFTLEKTVYTSDKHLVFEAKKRTDPAFNLEKNELEEEAWSHSTNIRLTKLTGGEQELKALFELFETRKALDTEECGFLLPFHDQGVIQYGNDLYYAERYDNPERDFEYWVNFDHQGLEIDVLDVYRLARGPLDAFKYLEEHGYVLTQFNEKNLYVGSFSEDRANFFRIMFKGHKDKSAAVKLPNKNQFSAPEAETTDVYKTYSFTVGLFVLWAVLSTNNKAAEFPKDIHAHPDKIPGLIKTVADLCYKDGGPNASLKEAFIVFLEDLLQVDIAKRQTAANLLTYKWVQECERLDYEEYQKEVEEYQKALAKEKEEDEKNR